MLGNFEFDASVFSFLSDLPLETLGRCGRWRRLKEVERRRKNQSVVAKNILQCGVVSLWSSEWNVDTFRMQRLPSFDCVIRTRALGSDAKGGNIRHHFLFLREMIVNRSAVKKKRRTRSVATASGRDDPE